MGGRLAILETDWDMCIYESNDRALTRRVIDARAAHCAHPYLPRQLPQAAPQRPACPSSGGAPIRSLSRATSPIRLAWASSELRATPRSSTACRLAVADTWAADVRSRTSEGEYFFCTNRLMFVAAEVTRCEPTTG